jgi:hypothetical protein
MLLTVENEKFKTLINFEYLKKNWMIKIGILFKNYDLITFLA